MTKDQIEALIVSIFPQVIQNPALRGCCDLVADDIAAILGSYHVPTIKFEGQASISDGSLVIGFHQGERGKHCWVDAQTDDGSIVGIDCSIFHQYNMPFRPAFPVIFDSTNPPPAIKQFVARGFTFKYKAIKIRP
ncbi:MAG: hypothetical protein EOP05_01710 [Proteobacteria bacterium]|nr:MAG: hypothetical protein EOP05_01710 [Pseudomonadota bacterium]